MRPDERDAAYLFDMLEAAREVTAMHKDVSLDVFLADRVLVRATERTLELIGEAARRVSPETQARLPHIPWREIIGQRNILAHEYGQVDHRLLFNTVSEDMPALIGMLEGLPELAGE